MHTRTGINQWTIMILLMILLILISCITPVEVQEDVSMKYLPRFSNCDFETNSQIDLNKCASKNMHAFIQDELNGFSKEYDLSQFTESFIVSFHVGTNGELTEIEIHNEADKLAKNIMLKIFNSMDRWIPAVDKKGIPRKIRLAMKVKIINGELVQIT